MPYCIVPADKPVPASLDGFEYKRLDTVTRPHYEIGHAYCDPGTHTIRAFRDLASYQRASDALAVYRSLNDGSFWIPWKVVYIGSDSDRQYWRRRERNRLYATSDYSAVPWQELLIGSVAGEQLDTIADREKASDRYVHLSLKYPGKVAYTESERKGYDDIQTPLTPARYLARFHPDIKFPQIAIDRFVSAIDVATKMPALQLTTDPDEIARIYVNGPSSCMGGKNNFSYGHPTAVYGHSDLAVAYLGDISDASARAVVWPDRRTYYKLYGHTERLRRVLESQGYTESIPQGARIRAINVGSNRWLMPYVDGIASGSLSNDGKWIILDNKGSINTQSTEGWTRDGEETRTCDHCGGDYSYDEDDSDCHPDLCPSCLDDCTSCDRCGDRLWSDTDECHSTADESILCDGCYDNASTTCDCCDESFCEQEHYNSRERRDRRNNGRTGVCPECIHNNLYPCEVCGDTWTDGGSRCDDCQDHDDTADESETNEPATDTTVAPAFQFIDPANVQLFNDEHYTLVRVVRDNESNIALSRKPGDLRICHMTDPIQAYGARTIPATGPRDCYGKLESQRLTLQANYPDCEYRILAHPASYQIPAEVIPNGLSMVQRSARHDANMMIVAEILNEASEVR